MLVGLTGRIESGKTTVADFLIYTKGYTKYSFASPLKEGLVMLTGLPMEYFTDQLLKSTYIPWLGMSPRELMQKLATDFIRDKIDPDFWVKRMENTNFIELLENKNQNLVIDDVRFENEAELIKSYGGVMVKIVRDCSPIDSHRSENIEVPSDIIITNNGTKKDLYKEVESYLPKI